MKAKEFADEKVLSKRLKIIEGQVRGVNKMITDGKYCVDILNQLTAIKGAIKKVEIEILKKHTVGCVSDAIRNDNGEDTVDELLDIVLKLMH